VQGDLGPESYDGVGVAQGVEREDRQPGRLAARWKAQVMYWRCRPVPSSRVNTRPVSLHASPYARRSSSWLRRCARRVSTTAAPMAMVRALGRLGPALNDGVVDHDPGRTGGDLGLLQIDVASPQSGQLSSAQPRPQGRQVQRGRGGRSW
jgi:hypothetical protein